MIQQQVTIIWNRQVGPQIHRLGLACDQGYSEAAPGQFVMVQAGKDSAPLLRRPFSIFGLLGRREQLEGIELLIKVVGSGTAHLAGLRPGQQLDLIGPLGRGFRVAPSSGPIYLAAGGVGVAPIHFLAADLIDLGFDPGRCRVFIGGQSRSDLLCQDEFKAFGMPVTVTTDDGSAGDQCLITDPLDMAIQERTPDWVYACGPQGMLACVVGIAERNHVACQVSIETVMACGLGACLGCAVRGRIQKDAYLHACMDGPVFDATEIELSTE